MVHIFVTRFDDGRAACTDGKSIWVDDRLNEIQLKCAIAHESIHIERGQGCRQTEAEEMSVRYETARRLIPDDGTVRGCKPGLSLAERARAWGVTRQVLMDRAATLTDEQAARAGCASCLLCPVMKARYADAWMLVAA